MEAYKWKAIRTAGADGLLPKMRFGLPEVLSADETAMKIQSVGRRFGARGLVVTRKLIMLNDAPICVLAETLPAVS
jgi:hypothetical protein